MILPHITGRPITMERYPAGIGKKGFWQKDVSKGFPDWLERVEVPKKDGVVHHPVITDERSLLVGHQPEHHHAARVDLARCRSCITPTSASSISIPRPTMSLRRRAAALGLRNLLDELGLPSWVKTSGSKGFHIVVPLDGKSKMGDVARFADAVGRVFVSHAPEHLTQEFSKVDRKGRIYVDTGRNGYSATFAAAYTVRAKRGAPVSAPCTWEEIETGKVEPASFNAENMPARIKKTGDLWADMLRKRPSLKRPIEKLKRMASSVH